MSKKWRLKLSSILLCLFLTAVWGGVSAAADSAFRATAYYVEGFEYRKKEGADPKILSIDPVVSWQGAPPAVEKYSYVVYAEKCDGDACEQGGNPSVTGETAEKKLVLDKENCPGWDCTIKIEALAKDGTSLGGPVYVSPEAITPTIPIIVVNTDESIPICDDSGIGTGIGDAEALWKIPGCFKDIECSILIVKPNGLREFDGDGEIELNGNSSRAFPKRQYGLELEDDKDLLGMREDDDWRLNGSWADRSLIQSKLTYDLYAKMKPENNFGARARYSELFINGEYHGIYLISEKVDRARLKEVFDLKNDDDKKGDRFLTDIVDMFKTSGIAKRGIYDYLSEEAPFRTTEFMETYRNHFIYELDFPKEEDLSMFMELKIIRYLSRLNKTAVSDGFDDPETGIFSFLDRQSVMDFIILQELTFNRDAYVGSVKMLRPTADLVRFIIWDVDLGFGNTWMNGGGAESAYEGFYDRPQLFYRVQRMPGFQDELLLRWRELTSPGGVLHEDMMGRLIDCYTGGECPEGKNYPEEGNFDISEGRVASTDAIARNYERWPVDDPEYQNILSAVSPGKSFIIDSFESERTRIKAWLKKRTEFLNGKNGWLQLLRTAEESGKVPESGARFKSGGIESYARSPFDIR